MIQALVSGILLGCVLALAVGPGFFMLINTSIKKGFIPAVMFASGILLSDAMYAFLTYYGSSVVLDLKNMGPIIGISGGLLLIGFGAFNLFKEPVVKASNIELDLSSKASFIDLLKGFSMNSLNPSVIIFWLGVVATVSGHESTTSGTVLAFYGSTLATVFGTDLLKSWIASRLKKVVTGNFLLWMNRISGLLLIGFGIFMIVRFMMKP